MGKMKMLLLILFLCPFVVEAQTCDNKIYDERVAESNLVKIVHKYNETNQLMTVEALNVSESFYFTVNTDIKKIAVIGGKAAIGSFAQGADLLVNYNTYDDLGCGMGNLVTKRYISLPYYNSYSKDERCNERPGLSACNEFYPKTLTEVEFEEALMAYDLEIYRIPYENTEPKKQAAKLPWFVVYRYIVFGAVAAIGVIIGLIIFVMKRRQLRSEL